MVEEVGAKEMPDHALHGLRVVDASESIAGQYCSRLFADFGADVVLVEPPGGSAIRRRPPFSIHDQGSLTFLHLNSGKRSVVAAAQPPADLLASADVVILPPGGRPALPPLAAATVTVDVTPFGREGPRAGWKGPEIVIQALSGMMFNNGTERREPLFGCGDRSSYAAGLAGYIGALAALRARDAGGAGQHVDIAAAETAAAMCFPHAFQHIYSGTLRTRADRTNPCGQILCRDGWICIWIYNHRWVRFCETVGLQHLIRDERFADPVTRRQNWVDLFGIIQAHLGDEAAEALVDRLQRADVIAAKSYRLTELPSQRHLAERGYWERLPDGRRILGPTFRLSRTPRRVRGGPPAIGQAPAMGSAGEARAVRPGASAAGGPLAGLRVMELTTAWAGPMAGRVLGFLGAECIHIESPNRVNSWRLNKERPNPENFPAGDPGARPYDRSFLFNSQNVNKLSCILDLKTEEGRAIARRLAAACDVVICNFRPGTLAKLGLDYESLRALRPDIIVAELPAFGLTGPLSNHAALGPTMEMAAGMSSLVGYRDGQPETTGPSYLDPIGGFNTAAAILTALHHRQRTGEGQHVEVPQVEAAMHLIGGEILAAAETGQDPVRDGNRVAHAAPHDAFPCAGDESWVVIAVRDDAEWAALCGVMGQPGLAADPRFASLSGRKRHEDEVSALVAAWTAGQDRHAVAERLQAVGVPAAAVQKPRDVAQDRHLSQRGFFHRLAHPDAGEHPHPGLPFRLSVTPGSQRRAAPAFGQHTEEVLGRIAGLSAQEIREAWAAKATASAPLPGG
jgi:crotonobetainyl-CoA:carnitine CoA-transferase CaiB-like acyl-CoA transferase